MYILITVIEFSFCDIRNYQVHRECYHAISISAVSILRVSNITKTSSSNYLSLMVRKNMYFGKKSGEYTGLLELKSMLINRIDVTCDQMIDRYL
jgi:hypothetical protein